MDADLESPELKGLVDELDELARLDVGALSGQALVAFLVDGRRQRDRFDALLARVGAAYVVEGSWKAAGFDSAAAYLASLRGEPDDAAGADLRLARALASMPVTAAALAEGSITRAHAERLRCAAGGSRAAAFAESEAMLVGMASSMDGHDFRRAVRYWVQVADDDAAEADAAARDRDRRCSVVTLFDGRHEVQAVLPAPAGEEFANALRAITEELFAVDWARARDRLGRTPAVAELDRTGPQRRCDALVEMARRAMAAPPGAKQPRPLLVVHLGASQELFGRLCELSSGIVLTPGEAARYLGVADLERAVHEPPDRVRVSARTRLFRGAERRAVELRDRYCTFPGCRVPAERCDIDHVTPYGQGGPTRQENGAATCPPHHPGRRRHQPWLRNGPSTAADEGDPADPPAPDEHDTS